MAVEPEGELVEVDLEVLVTGPVVRPARLPLSALVFYERWGHQANAEWPSLRRRLGQVSFDITGRAERPGEQCFATPPVDRRRRRGITR